jgi:hypothetical protein
MMQSGSFARQANVSVPPTEALILTLPMPGRYQPVQVRDVGQPPLWEWNAKL